MKDDAEDGKAFSLTTAYSSLLAPAPHNLASSPGTHGGL